MPKIDKPKKLTNLPVKSRKAKTATRTKKRVKHSPIDYYHCLLTQAQNNWFDPVLGTKKKITACCKECKLNAPKLNETRSQEIQKLVTSYQQVGESLAKLLRPIK